jgi:hypothetical protein
MPTFDIGYLKSLNHLVTTFHYCYLEEQPAMPTFNFSYLEAAAYDAHL